MTLDAILKKYAYIVGAILLGSWLAAFYFGRQTVWTEVGNAPADTVTVETVDSLYIERVTVRVDTFRVTKVDTVKVYPDEPRWYAVTLDTVVSGVRIHADYLSPLPLSPRGFFSNIRVSCPDTLVKVPIQTHYITKVVVNRELPTEWIVAIFGAGFAVGAYSFTR